MMRKKLYLLFFFILILSTEMALGKNDTKTKFTKAHKKHSYLKDKSNDGRTKRSLNDDTQTFLPNLPQVSDFPMQFDDLEQNNDNMKKNSIENEPFWGTRGRRDSSEKNIIIRDLADNFLNTVNGHIGIDCKHCFKPLHKLDDINKEYSGEKREEVNSPFWGNRGRRNSDNDDRNQQDPFWGVRGRRQENEPFWGTRGRRQDDSSPYWGNKGIWEDEPFWGQRGRREESEPFWGNRGRREDDDPFWGTRGRREQTEPFWGNRGKKKEHNLFSNADVKEKEELKSYIRNAINIVEHNIQNLARLRRSDSMPVASFWANRGRTSQLNSVFNGKRLKNQRSIFKQPNLMSLIDPAESRTVLDNRIYAEEPHFILVERSSRSSSEDDPFFISRGKKKFINFKLTQAARDRRGSIEELVKSVRNDPYYIARGKKDSNKSVKLGNSTVLRENLKKLKDLICATVDLIMIKSEHSKLKREVDENERDRRTILKKLAAQLQNDPYFASRGKKKEKDRINDDSLVDFISAVATKCY